MTKPIQSKILDNLFAGEGEMSLLMRAHDWNNTPLGPVETWPQSLRTTVSILLNSRYPMFTFWGTKLINLYNDSYRLILGDKHPWALGQSGPEIWSEIWDSIGPMVDQAVSTGQATWSDNLPLFPNRKGYLEETFFTFSYSPVRDETGNIGGMFCACTETTKQVLGDRRLHTLRDLAACTGEAETTEKACQLAMATLGNNAADVPFALLYLLNQAGTEAHLVATTGLEPGTTASPKKVELFDTGERPWPLAEVAHTPQTQRIRDVIERVGQLKVGLWPDPPHTALILPVASPGQTRPTGLLITGISPRLSLDDDYQGFLELVAGQVATIIADVGAYEAAKQRAEALAEIDRAKTVFFSNVSHEFRTPLTLMLAPLEDLLADGADPLSPTQRDRLEIAQRNSLRLLKLVNTLLDFSRIEAGRTQACYQLTDIATLTKELASSFRSLMERAGLTLIVNCPPLGESVYVDQEMWEKIVLNLLSNAFKYTLAGSITVKVQGFDDHIELSVIDTGIGIPEADLPHLFERFHRVKGAQGRSFEGSGIGLSLVQELVKLHGGQIKVNSSLGQGSCFTICLPRGCNHLPHENLKGAPKATHDTPRSMSQQISTFVEEASRWLSGDIKTVESFTHQSLTEVSRGQTVKESPRDPLRGARILLADDNADMRDYVKRLLQDHYLVETVADGVAALESIQQQRPDLLLTDIMMPRLNGLALLQQLRSSLSTQDLPIILLSARAGEESRIEGLQAKADDYLIKPFSSRELLARVEACLKMAQIRQEAAAREQTLRLATEKAQQAVAATTEKLNRILATISDGFILLDPEWVITYHNTATTKLFPAKSHPLGLGKTLWEVWPSWVNTDLEHRLRYAMTEQVSQQCEYHCASSLTEELWLEIYAYSFEEGLGIFLHDISDRKRSEAERHKAEIALKQYSEQLELRVAERTAKLSQTIAELHQVEEILRGKETHYRQALNLTNTGSWEFDLASEKVFWSEQVEIIWGMKPGTFRGEFDQVKAGIHPQDFDLWQQNVQACIEEGKEHNLEFRVVHPDGSIHWVQAIGNAEYDSQGHPIRLRGLIMDVTERKTSQERLNYMAHHDHLTDLPNRLLLKARLDQSIQQATRKRTKLAVVFIDLDRFKHINDSMGHAAGDALLQQLAQRLRQVLRSSDTVARISGDEFVAVLEDIEDIQHASMVVAKLMTVFEEPFPLEGQIIHMTSSMGLSLFPDDGMDTAILLRNADSAMYRAKEEGRNTYCFYAEEMTSAAFEYVLFENALRGALKRNEFYLVYQPQIDLSSHRWVGMEVLLRWHHPELGIVSPAQFIPIAEQSGLIQEIGTWVLYRACCQAKTWLDQGIDFGHIAVNVAAPQIQQNNFVHLVQDALDSSGLPSPHLELELTEGLVMHQTEDRIKQLEVLQDMGIYLAIDDFGTGYSSLSYLKRLPINKLKIDKSFVRDIPHDTNDMAISEAVIALGKALNLRIIAEGVEQEIQATFLREKGCHEAQGYLYSKPLPPEEITQLFAEVSQWQQA